MLLCQPGAPPHDIDIRRRAAHAPCFRKKQETGASASAWIMDRPPSDMLQTAAAWPFEQARALVKRLEKSGKQTALFETGYGPSGLPHIGTFKEVVRTTMVRHALRRDDRRRPTRLIAFSDDMDGMRKVPPATCRTRRCCTSISASR